ncbi:unnamed protein product [Oppiella nova]|uniref:Uncharacterized protein n=1 Tax=Oppiella nova TaxID=334625 RepID=A0A7R9MUM2_9ACAR|nr:unnamed protein product [Oppiella nova]CAG2183149.1 unnamed protein product [Oppiella nova]
MPRGKSLNHRLKRFRLTFKCFRTANLSLSPNMSYYLRHSYDHSLSLNTIYAKYRHKEIHFHNRLSVKTMTMSVILAFQTTY